MISAQIVNSISRTFVPSAALTSMYLRQTWLADESSIYNRIDVALGGHFKQAKCDEEGRQRGTTCLGQLQGALPDGTEASECYDRYRRPGQSCCPAALL